MYNSDRLKRIDDETFSLRISKDKDFRILQLTDLHLGFGMISRKKNKLALEAHIPYSLVFGNHDCEMGSTCNREELADIYEKAKYSIFTKGRKELTGVGNFLINLVDDNGNILLPMVMLDSNMYGDGGWFFSGFDCIHDDQVEWCMGRLDELKQRTPDIRAMAFFHMPPREFKEAYEKMKLGDKSVIYQHGSIAEKNEHFGISKFDGTFFRRAVENGVIKWIFCGHDHMNTLSLIYQGIQMTYGMSIDYLGYKDIKKSYIQRGGTLITRKPCGDVEIKMVPLGSVVSTRVRGVKG